VLFGAVMLIVSGAFNAVDGVTALVAPEHFHGDVLVASLTAWGWCFAIYGAVEAMIGIAVLRGSAVALWPGIVVVGFNAFLQMAAMGNYPAWSIAIIVVDILVIYGFAVEGMEVGTEVAEPEAAVPAPDERLFTPNG
jgi:hypothetical protein